MLVNFDDIVGAQQFSPSLGHIKESGGAKLRCGHRQRYCSILTKMSCLQTHLPKIVDHSTVPV